MKTEKDLEYYRKNAEEDYLTTPISVLRYISEMEEALRIGAVSNSEVFEHYGKPFTSGRDLWDFLTAHYNFKFKTK